MISKIKCKTPFKLPYGALVGCQLLRSSGQCTAPCKPICAVDGAVLSLCSFRRGTANASGARPNGSHSGEIFFVHVLSMRRLCEFLQVPPLNLRNDHWPYSCGCGKVISGLAVTVCPWATSRSTIRIECTSLRKCDHQPRPNKADIPIRVP